MAIVGKVRHSASAETDLLEAWLYIAEDSIEAADRLLDRIDAETRWFANGLLAKPTNEGAAGASGPTLTNVNDFRAILIDV